MKSVLKRVMSTVLILSSLSSVIMANDSAKADSVNGAQVWADTCMRCHNLREPSSLSKRAWKFSMNHMRVRAGLTGQETRDILRFILESKTSEDSK